MTIIDLPFTEGMVSSDAEVRVAGATIDEDQKTDTETAW
jgi:hypothetical protein